MPWNLPEPSQITCAFEQVVICLVGRGGEGEGNKREEGLRGLMLRWQLILLNQ